MNILDAAKAWAALHPLTVTLAVLAWPAVTSLWTAIFHPRSREEYAALPPRRAAFFKLIAAVGCDLPKAARAFALVVAASTPAERAKALLALLASFTVDAPKAVEAIKQIVTGKDIPS